MTIVDNGRLHRSQHGKVIEDAFQNCLSLIWFANLFVVSKRQYTRPRKIALNVVDLDASAGILAQALDFLTGQGVGIDEVFLVPVVDWHYVGFAIHDTAKPGQV
jgi:hypothetical protein